MAVRANAVPSSDIVALESAIIVISNFDVVVFFTTDTTDAPTDARAGTKAVIAVSTCVAVLANGCVMLLDAPLYTNGTAEALPAHAR